MEVCVKDSAKIVEVWLTNTEKDNTKIRQSLQPMYEKYKQKKYKVAVFESGHGGLLDNTAGLLLHNRKLNLK